MMATSHGTLQARALYFVRKAAADGAGASRSTAMTTRELLPSPSSPGIRMQREDEFELLCVSAGAELSAERRERIAHWNLSALDWGKFLRLAEHHGVLPLAARNLVEHGRGFPPEIERSLGSR